MSDTHTFIHGNLLKKCPPEIDIDNWNLFLEEMDRASNMEFLDHPVQIDVELNSGCNMKCPFCLHGYEDITNKNIGIDTYYKIIDEAVEIGVTSLKLNYINEPMLRKDLEDCIRYAKDKGILNIYLATNGSLLNAKRRKSMLESGITKIFVSIDAITPETYNLQRLDGRYRLVVENVCALIKERNELGRQFPIIRVSFLKNTLNLHEAQEFENYWKDKADIIAFQKMNEVPDMNTGLAIKDLVVPDKGCEFPFKQLVVETEGNILPCCKLSGKKLVIGNIKDMTLKEAWNSNSMKSLQKMHASDDWKNHKICFDCIMCGE